MIIYNVTINIHESVHQQWMDWMQKHYIAGILATGKFDSARLVKVLVEEELGGITYSVQFTTKDKETLEQFYAEDSDAFELEGLKHFGSKMLSFKTELELVSEHK